VIGSGPDREQAMRPKSPADIDRPKLPPQRS
jgi:hypothetical protein